ncbi:MAG: CcmD family protein [Chloroflexi bacterium]|nr:CcmD family protein [Chloroflexota bacterium]
MDNLVFLFIAYAVVWTVLFGYLWSLDQRRNELKKDIQWLKESLPKINQKT